MFDASDTNGTVNNLARRMIRQNIVINPTDYQQKNPDQPFFNIKLADYASNDSGVPDVQEFKKELKKVASKIDVKNRKFYISSNVLNTVGKYSEMAVTNGMTQIDRFQYLEKVFEDEKGNEKQWEEDWDALDNSPSIETIDKLLNNPYIRTFNTDEKSKSWKFQNKIWPEIMYTWHHRKGETNPKKTKFTTEFEQITGRKKNFTYQKESYYAPYMIKAPKSVNEDGFRIETVVSNENMPKTLKLIKERLVALESKTFLSYAFFTGRDTPLEEDRACQTVPRIGTFGWILMTEAGITGIDFQSTRRSLRFAQPYRSPGLKDQFVGRLVRNVSHGLIPKLFQRTEYVTFYNSIKRSKTSHIVSTPEQPWRYFDQYESKKEDYNSKMKQLIDDKAQEIESKDEDSVLQIMLI